MCRVHLLTQYIWPDAAPTGLYAEHLATRLQERGWAVTLAGGSGTYRPLSRDKPKLRLRYLEHYRGRRGSLAHSIVEYVAVKRAFEEYIAQNVKRCDIVVCTSAPPNTVVLAAAIRERGARAIYWLQDYYPELIRGIREYPAPLRKKLCSWWNQYLGEWDVVVKIGGNLAGPEENSVVIRNWPTIRCDFDVRPEPKTALYLGNLGYGHDVGLFIQGCERLRENGYAINIFADGPGVRRLPRWLKAKPPLKSVAESRHALLRHELHLIAASPTIQRGIFPSKIWNSIAVERELLCTGFAGEMLKELNESRTASYDTHIDQWIRLLEEVAQESEPILACVA